MYETRSYLSSSFGNFLGEVALAFTFAELFAASFTEAPCFPALFSKVSFCATEAADSIGSGSFHLHRKGDAGRIETTQDVSYLL